MSQLMDRLALLDELNVSAEPAADQVERCLLNYLEVSNQLAYTSPEVIAQAQRTLGRTAIKWAFARSPVYRERMDASWCQKPDCLDRVAGQFFVQKSDLLVKDQWYVTGVKSTQSHTSGSTGAPFKYRVWDSAFLPIERDHHYLMILREFGLDAAPRVLHMVSGISLPDYTLDRRNDCVFKVSRDEQIRGFLNRLHCGHGSPDALCAHIEFNEQAFIHINDYCSYVIDFIKENHINVLLASGVVFELLTTHLIADETHTFPELVVLASNTGDRVNPDTLDFLRETGVAKHTCDHMRCWDGGVGFFTCKEGTYHLNEDLAYVFTDSEKRLASIDFFALGSPFVNYLNGDMGEIENDWTLCKCGRWYRPFKFHNRRGTLQQSGSGYYDTTKVEKYLKQNYRVDFIGFQDSLVSIEDSHLSPKDKMEIVESLAREQVAVSFFTRPNLTGISMLKQNTPTDPGTITPVYTPVDPTPTTP